MPNDLIPLSSTSVIRLMKDKSAVDAPISSKAIRQDVREYEARFQLWVGARGMSVNLDSERQ